MFAGQKIANLATSDLSSVQNVMNMQSDAHVAFDELCWGIEAKEADDGIVRARTLMLIATVFD